MATLQEFITKIQDKYGRLIEPSGISSLTTNVLTGEKVVSPQGGSRFTGLGPDGKLQKSAPAGVVHEGEQVVEADMVRKAGGPAKIRGAVENLAQRTGQGQPPMAPSAPAPGASPADAPPVEQPPINNVKGRGLPGFREGTGTRVVNRLPGYQPGTGDDVVTDPNQQGDAGTAGDQETPFGTSGSELIGQTAEALQAQAEGTDEGFQKLKTLNRLNLASRQSADVQKQAQTIAQTQKTGGEAAATMAGLQRTHGIESAVQEQQFLEADIVRKDTAMAQLKELGVSVASLEEARAGRLSDEEYRDKVFDEDIDRWEKMYDLDLQAFAWGKKTWGDEFNLEERRFGLTEKQFDEFKRQFNESHSLELQRFNLDERQFEEFQNQFDDTMDLNWAQFEQNKEQFGLDYALRSMAFNFETNNVMAQAALAAGDFDAASEYYSNMGIKAEPHRDLAGNLVVDFKPLEHGIDMGRLENQANRVDFDNNLGDLRAAMLDMGSEIHNIQNFNQIPEGRMLNSLKEMYRLGVGREPEGAVFEEWAMNQLDGIRLSQDPYHSAVAQLDNTTIEAIIEGRGLGDDVQDFSYGNATGIEAGRRAIVTLLAGGGMKINEDGSLVYDNTSDAWDVFMAPTITQAQINDENITDIGDFNPDSETSYDITMIDGQRSVVINGEGVKPGGKFISDGVVYEYTGSQFPEHRFKILGQAEVTPEGDPELSDLIQTAVQSGDVSGFSSGNWETIGKEPKMIEQLQEAGVISDTFDSNNTQHVTLDDFTTAGYTADVINVEHRDDSVDGLVKNEDASAGEGKGSIVLYNGKPYRLTKFNSHVKKPMFGRTQRFGEVWAVPMSDPNSEPIQLYETDWVDQS